MKAPSSRLSERIRSKYRKEINEMYRKGISLIGQKFEIDGKTYIITDGEPNIRYDILNKCSLGAHGFDSV